MTQPALPSISALVSGLVLAMAVNVTPLPHYLALVQTAHASSLTKNTKVSLRGVNGIAIGMTVQEATKASGHQFVGNNNRECSYYKIPTVSGMTFMVTNGRITRIDVTDNSAITTLSGAKIGDRESKIKALYPGQIRVEPHKYNSSGHYLVFVPQDASDQQYRLIFEADGNIVTRWRVGTLPEVEWVEGCS